MTQILPAILATTEEGFKTNIDQVESSGLFKDGWVQIDLMDNKFVPNTSIGLDVLAKYNISSKKEAQLMVTEPHDWVGGLADAHFERVIFPIEIGNTADLIKYISEYSLQIGISLNPETPVDTVVDFLDTIDLVLLMGVHPGFQGQQFIPETIDRVRQLATFKEHSNFLIEVDGGVSTDSAKDLVDAGADILVVGSRLLNGNIKENLEKIKRALGEG